jgi:ferric enterobactin receptor
MIQSDQKIRLSSDETVRSPLSTVPKHTVNAFLEWRASEKLTLIPSIKSFGDIDAPRVSIATGDDNPEESLAARKAYSLVDFALAYQMSEQFLLSAGAKNIFDREVFRSGVGANTFNESGREFYMGLSLSF